MQQGSLFALRVMGVDWSPDRGKELLDCPIGRLANSFPVVYRDNRLTVDGELTIDEVKSRCADEGIRIPTGFLDSVESALSYLERYGRQYLFGPFEELSEEEIWLDPYLQSKLRRGYTDFDLQSRFPELITDRLTRPEMIKAIVEFYRPAGYFWIVPGGLVHELETREVYTTVQAVESVVQNGRLLFKGRVCDRMGLYQLAYLLKPESWEKRHGIEPTQETRSLYSHVLEQISISESRGEQQIRFGGLSEFTDDLDRSLRAYELSK